MSTWQYTVETGSGEVALRVMIPGHPIEWVSDVRLAGPSTDGRVRIGGLIGDSISFGERLDPAQNKLNAKGCTAEIVEDIVTQTGDSFVKLPTQVNYLTASIDDTVTVIPLAHSGTANGDVLFIGLECMLITSGGGTAAPTVTRAYRQTRAQYHYVDDVMSLPRPEVTNTRPNVEGLTAFVFAYGEGETGDGTVIWRGLITSQPKLRGTTTWEMPLASVMGLFDQNLSNDLQQPVGLGGVNYGSVYVAPKLTITRLAGATPASAVTTDTLTIQVPVGPSGGYYYDATEGYGELLTLMNIAIVSQTSGWAVPLTNSGPGSLQFIAYGPGSFSAGSGYTLRYTTGATPYWLNIQWGSGAPGVDPYLSNAIRVMTDAQAGSATMGDDLATLVANHVYEVPTSGGPAVGVEPAGFLGTYSGGRVRGAVRTSLTDVIQLNNTGLVADVGDQLILQWPEYNGQTQRTIAYEVLEAPASGLSLSGYGYRVACPDPSDAGGQRSYNGPDGAPKVTVSRNYGRGNVASFLTALVVGSAQKASLGQQPYLTIDHVDIIDCAAAVDPVTAGRAWVNDRSYGGSQEYNLSKILVEEQKLAGLCPIITVDGRFSLREFRFAAATETGIFDLTPSNNLTTEQIPGFEPNPYGLVNSIFMKTGFNPLDGKHTGDTFFFRDGTSLSRNPIPTTMKIEPRSSAAALDVLIPVGDVTAMAQSWFGSIGAPYVAVGVLAPLSAFNCVVGSAIAMTVDQLPNQVEGGRGFTDSPGFVIERMVRPSRGTVELTAILTSVRIAGYTPSSMVTAAPTFISPGVYDITLDAVQPGGYAAAADARWVIGDAIVLRQWDVVTPSQVQGTITAINTGTGILRVAVPAPPASPLTLEYNDAFVATAAQELYCFIAGDDDLIGFASAFVPARQFAA